MPKYRILHPVGYNGRRERGEIVEAPEGRFSPDMAERIEDEQEAQTPTETEEEAPTEEAAEQEAQTPTEERSKEQLQEDAAERGLPTSGSKADLVERIKLHDENAAQQ